jgi:hypothetical protein
MKKLLIIVLLSLTSLAQAEKITAPPASIPTAPTPAASKAVYLMGVANYFKALTKQRKCVALNFVQYNSINKRLENARLRLVAQYGEQLFPANAPTTTPIRNDECDQGTLNSYSTHVEDVEKLLNNPS